MRANGGDKPQSPSVPMGTCGRWKWRNTFVASEPMALPLLPFSASILCSRWENVRKT